MALLTVDDLGLSFGGVRALDGAHLSAEEGQIVGLIGPNGSGKTTLLNCISGFYRPTRGSIRWRGQGVAGRPAHRVARMGIARTFQNVELAPTLTVEENIGVSLTMSAAGRKRVQEIAGFLGIDEHLAVPAGELSYPNRKRVEIGRALAMNPKLLLLDEPASGCDDRELASLAEVIRSIRTSLGVAILLIEHHVEFVMALCERIVVLNFGKTIASGTPEEIRRHPDVVEAYLGAS